MNSHPFDFNAWLAPLDKEVSARKTDQSRPHTPNLYSVDDFPLGLVPYSFEFDIRHQ
jgi:hypothetical protein